jgi:hypothetical protein
MVSQAAKERHIIRFLGRALEESIKQGIGASPIENANHRPLTNSSISLLLPPPQKEPDHQTTTKDYSGSTIQF